MSIGVSLVVLISLAFSLAPTSSATKERDLRLMRSWQRSGKCRVGCEESSFLGVCFLYIMRIGQGVQGGKSQGHRTWGTRIPVANISMSESEASRVDGVHTCFFSAYYRQPKRQVMHVCSLCVDTSIHVYVNVFVIFRCVMPYILTLLVFITALK